MDLRFSVKNIFQTFRKATWNLGANRYKKHLAISNEPPVKTPKMNVVQYKVNSKTLSKLLTHSFLNKYAEKYHFLMKIRWL